MKIVARLLLQSVFFLVCCTVYGQEPTPIKSYADLLQIKSEKEFNVSYAAMVKQLFETEKDLEKRTAKMNQLTEIRKSYIKEKRAASLLSKDSERSKKLAKNLANIMKQRYALTVEQETKLINIIERNMSARLEAMKSSQDSIVRKNSLQNIRKDYEEQLSKLLTQEQYQKYQNNVLQGRVRIEQARQERDKSK